MTVIKRLIYLSSSVDEMTPDGIAAILEVSRRNNARAGVTGLLLFHDGCFFQALEGPVAEVDRIFATISADARHSGVIVLERSMVDTRAFDGWSMGFVGAAKLSADQRRSLIDLASLVGSDERQAFTTSAPAALHIDAFLNSFREFA